MCVLMAKQSGYLQRVQIANELHDMRLRDFMRTFILDVVTLTLGKIGFSPEDLEYFRDEYMLMEEDFMDEILEDFYHGQKNRKNRDICVAKAHIDRALQEYVKPEMFVPYDERYSYCEERKKKSG